MLNKQLFSCGVSRTCAVNFLVQCIYRGLSSRFSAYKTLKFLLPTSLTNPYLQQIITGVDFNALGPFRIPLLWGVTCMMIEN